MKSRCQSCEVALRPDGEAYFCSYECTFCPQCADKMNRVCRNCGGELLRRPRRRVVNRNETPAPSTTAFSSQLLLWGVSFAVWLGIALAATFVVYEAYLATDTPMSLLSSLWWEFGQVLTYAPLTPLVFTFATRYPIRRDNWGRRSLLYLAGGLVFTAAHLALRAATPYAFWNPTHHQFVSAIWDYRAHVFRLQWQVLWNHFFTGVIDDITGVFIPIVVIAHAISYYRRFRERELRAGQLEAQLAKTQLLSLKSQLQPHFLFNTMHSISSLMLVDVLAADQMMTRLGDLLRMSLETAETQLTTLSQELDFVNCYLEIERVRFGERLNVTMEIAPETLDASFPHLLLQPIVDNAVKHGIAKLPGGGDLRITVRALGDQLQVEVEDNGPGFDNLRAVSASGFGLRIAKERLESLYGTKQSFELLAPPVGTIARIRIPFHPFKRDAGRGRADSALSRTG